MFESTYSEHNETSIDNRLRTTLRAFVCFVLLIVFSTAVHAQTATGQFNGHVFDENGAVLVGATVTLSNTQSGLNRTATTNGEGLYRFPLLAPGNYKITTTHAGFQSALSPELQLDVNQISTQDFHMQVGAVTETVDVSASAELLQASSTELGVAVEERTVNELPLNGRNFTALLTLAPGVSAVNYAQTSKVGYGSGNASPGLPTATFVFPSVQGQWNRENVYFMDGIINTAAFGGSYDVPPIVDVIQEFKIQSHNDVAEFGGVLGGVVNLVTKSGTNSYHGSMWEYLRNNAFDARNPFSDFAGNTPTRPASFHQNEFGAALGGPVIIPKLYNGKNKTFFFGAYEGWRYSKAVGIQYISPTAAELNGDFTNPSVLTTVAGQKVPARLYNPFTTAGVAGNYTRQLLGGDGLHVPSNLIDPIAQAFLKNYGDTPNFTPTTPGGNNTILNAAGTDNANQFNARVDQNFGPNDILWFRYSQLSGANDTPTKFHQKTVGSTTNRNFGGGYTHVFSPTLILDLRAGYSGRFNAATETKPIGVTAPTGYAGVESVYGHPSFTFNNSYSSIGGSGPSGSAMHSANYAANITWLRGNHQVRFGFQQVVPERAPAPEGKHGGGASFTFDAAGTSNPQPGQSGITGNALASALMGLPNNGRYQTGVSAVRFWATSAYIQDSWKATPRLTINAGLRWDGESSPHILVGNAAMLDPQTGNWIVSGGKLPPPCNPAGGVFAPCLPSTTPANNALIADHVKVADNPNLGPDGVYTDFGPRLGIAYKLDSTTALRAGYGLVYDNLQGAIQTISDRLLAWPSNASLPLVFNVTGQPLQTMAQITPTLSSENALPAVSEPFHQAGWYYDPHLKNHYSHQFNLDIQKELRSNLVASISYVGSVNKRLPLTGLLNNSPVPGQAGANRLFPWSGSAIMATSRGEANYHSFQAKVEKRMRSGFAFGSGYTWGKSLDNGASGFFASEDGPAGKTGAQNYNDLSQNYGLSSNSIAHTVYGWAIYELPFGKGKSLLNHGFVTYLAGGWQANANLSAHSGPPLTFPDAGLDPAAIGNTSTFAYARANVSGSPRVDHPTAKVAFNTGVFSHPVKQYGTSGRGIINGMPYDNVDFSLLKGVTFADRATLQFRAEFFNVLNIQNYGLPVTTYGAARFGEISGLASGSTPRQMQFGLRASF